MTQPLSGLAEGLAEVEGIASYVIPDLDALPTFLVNLVSPTDHWCFISTSGALTAGRRDADTALLPYETDDRLHEAAGTVGPVTVVRVPTPGGTVTWEPFGRCPDPRARRAAAKSVLGDVLWLEESHPDLPLVWRCRWATSDEFGLIRRVELVATGALPSPVEVLDGLIGVLPHGVPVAQQQTMRNLVAAYRRSEPVPSAQPMAVHALESLIVDQAIPAESLRATVTWSHTPFPSAMRIDPGVLRAVRGGVRADAVTGTDVVTGRPGAHLLSMDLTLTPDRPATWYLAADVAVDHVGLARLRQRLADTDDVAVMLESSIEEGSRALSGILGGVDGPQVTADPVACAHHLSNTLFNAMRGGVFADGGCVGRADFIRFVGQRNRGVADAHQQWLASLPAVLTRVELLARAAATGDPHLHRLALEHLPLFFARRHGDPSRPWNRFSIRVRDAEGHPVLGYEGNWRDIFQNWEALCQSHPAYLTGAITTFVNASTIDGFNPYRITREGIDWEMPAPEDPWSNIGYWGDHQVVYLHRLLQAADRWHPGALDDLLERPMFTYADVPYRLASYDSIVADPRNTIAYDDAAAATARARAEEIGGDGLLVHDGGSPVVVTLLEKLLVPALSKLAALVPDGGIWMHTQRPEWNDANNALVGNGLSVVTLFHLHGYLRWLTDRLARLPAAEVALSGSVRTWLEETVEVMAAQGGVADRPADPEERAEVMAGLGRAFQAHRDRVATDGLGHASHVPAEVLRRLVDTALPLVAGTLRRARRDDGLVHSYNLLHLDDGGTRATVSHLPVMLEGQVAALGGDLLDHAEAADLLDALATSDLYTADRDTYLLYPHRMPPAFVDKNVVPAALVDGNPLLRELAASPRNGVIAQDVDGVHRFAADLANAADLAERLDELAGSGRWTDLIEANRDGALEVWEAVFDHHAFTGRSGGMHAYEGLGSVYWHMVGKLLVAVQERTVAAHLDGADAEVVDRLRAGYRRVRRGLGFNRSAEEFGAFPTDAYSHTPAHNGAQQPGMTGLVKEMLLTRPGELGIWIRGGRLVIDPLLLEDRERFEEAVEWSVEDIDGNRQRVPLAAGELGLMVCQVPVVVGQPGPRPRIEVVAADGTTGVVEGPALTAEATASIAERTGAVRMLRVQPAADRSQGLVGDGAD